MLSLHAQLHGTFFLISRTPSTILVAWLIMVLTSKLLLTTLVFLLTSHLVNHTLEWMHIFAKKNLLVYYFSKVMMTIRKIDQCNQYIFNYLELQSATSLIVWWIILGMVSMLVKRDYLDSQVLSMQTREFITWQWQDLHLKD